MRLTLRILALVSLAVLGSGLFLNASSYLRDPCPRVFFFQLFLALFGVYGLLPTVIGSATRRRWGWLAGLVVASVIGLAFLYGAASDQPPQIVLAAVGALSWTFDQALGLTMCGSQSSPFVQAAAVMVVLLAAPLALLSYSFSVSAAP